MPAKALAKRQSAVFFVGKLDLNSPATLEKFKSASKAYTVKVTKSKASALKALKKEGFLTKSGKLKGSSLFQVGEFARTSPAIR